MGVEIENYSYSERNQKSSEELMFTQEFESCYLRSNKSNGMKTLRCFPACSPSGHTDSRFCGNSVVVKSTIRDNEHDVEFWARIGEVRGNLDLQIGQALPSSYFEEHAKSKDNRLGEWFRGDVSRKDSSSVQVCFNEELGGWYYMWKSHKNSSNTEHTFYVLKCIRKSADTILIVDMTHSPAFTIVSRNCKGNSSMLKKRKATDSNTDRVAFEKEFSDPQPLPKRTEVASPFFSEVVQQHGEDVHIMSEDSSIFGGSMFSMFSNGIWNRLRGGSSPADDLTNWALPPKNSEHRANRTLDRLYLLVTDFHFSTENVIGDLVNPLSLLLRKLNNLRTSFKESTCIELFKILNESFLLLIQEHSVIEMVTLEWANKLDALQEKIRIELHQGIVEWKPEVEDSKFQNGSSIDQSLYASFRETCRNVMRNALIMSNLSVADFDEYMNIASRDGILADDPFHPPTLEMCYKIQQVVNSGKDMSYTYSTGESQFRNLESFKRFGLDFLHYRQNHFRHLLLDRIQNQTKLKKALDSTNLKKLDGVLDFSGTWIDIDAKSNVNPVLIGVLGELYGAFWGKIFRQLFVRVQVVLSRDLYSFQGRSMFMCTGKSFWLLDGNVHELIPAHPIAQVTSFFAKERKRYTAFMVKINDTHATIVVAVDYRIVLPASWVQARFPDYYRKCPAESYNYYMLVVSKYEPIHHLDIILTDYLVPTNFREFEFTSDYFKHMYLNEMFFCSSMVMSYYRTSVSSDEENLVNDLLLGPEN